MEDHSYLDDAIRDISSGGNITREPSPSIRLQSALKTHADYLKNKNAKKVHDEILEYHDVIIPTDCTPILGSIWKKCLDRSSGAWSNFISSQFPRFNRDFSEIFSKEIEILSGTKQPPRIDLSLSYLMDNLLKLLAPSLLSLYLFFSFIVTIQHDPPSGIVTSSWKIEIDDVNIYWTRYEDNFRIGIRDMWALIYTKGKKIMIHRDHLLNICDKLGERLNCLIFSHISYVINQADMITPEFLLMIFQWGDDIIKSHGSEGFQLISNYEALVVGEILCRGDPDLWEVNLFQKNVIEDLLIEIPWSLPYIERLKVAISGLTPDQLCDIHGLYRIWGHPEVRILGGLEKMMKISKMNKTIDLEKIKISSRMFKEIFFSNYLRKHKHYPKHTTVDSSDEDSDTEAGMGAVKIRPPDYLLECLKDNKELRIREARYDMSSWDKVIIEKNFEVPQTWNLAHNIKDKAVSPDRTELKTSILRGLGAIWQDARRTVLKWLTMNIISMRDFLSSIDLVGLDPRHLIIGLYAKERELKYFPRFFSLMSFYLRLYVVSTEQLISDNLLPYFPQITMTTDLLNMTKKILKLSGMMKNSAEDMMSEENKKSSSVSYSINIDFKKWNQQMRYDITEPVFRCIDQSFGFNNVIRRTHQFFKRCYIYLCSGEYIPQVSGDDFIIEEPWSWMGDESGKEGLRQKGWTIMTVCMIEHVLRRHAATSQLIGGGDNQVLVVTIQTESITTDGKITTGGKKELKEKMERILRDLDDFFSSVGLPLKINETWVSPDLFMYNKIMCFRGRSLRSCLKTASRTFPFSDEAAMTIHGMMSTLGTNIKALCSRDFSHISSYIFSRWIALLSSFMIYYMHPLLQGGIKNMDGGTIRYCHGGRMLEKPIKKGDVGLTKILFNCMYYFRVFGGYAMGVPSEWVMRGFPDPLTGALSWTSRLLKILPRTNRYWRDLLSSIKVSKKSGEPSYLHLISDPVSINHDGPMHGLARLREEAEKAIVNSELVTNRDLKTLARVCYSKNSEDLLKALCSSKILEPKFLHEMYGATLYGYFNSIVSRVDKSATIMRLNKKLNVMESLRDTEKNYVLHTSLRCEEPYDLEPVECSRITAQYYRDYTWGKKISGVTIPCPVEVFSAGLERNHQGCDENFILLNTMPHELKSRPYGPLEPYLGSFTDEKFKLSPIANAFGEEALLTKAIHLQKLRHWRYSDGTDMYRVVEKILESECDLDPNSVFVICQSSSSAVHRFAGDVLSHGAIMNANPDMYRFFSITTSTLTKRAKGGRNDMIHFQACLLWITSMMVNRMNISKEESGTSHFHEMCNTCIYPVEDIQDSDTQLTVDPKIPIMSDNKLAYVRAVDIHLNYAESQLVKKYQVLGCMLSRTESDEEEEQRKTDAISQEVFLLMAGEKRFTGSQLSKLLENSDPQVVFGKIKSLITATEVITSSEFDLQKKSRVLEPMLCSRNLVETLRAKSITIEGKTIGKRGQAAATVIPKLMECVQETPPAFITTLDCDPLLVISAMCFATDPTLKFCSDCRDSITSSLARSTTEKMAFYHCKNHIPRRIPILRYIPTDAYSISKESGKKRIDSLLVQEQELRLPVISMEKVIARHTDTAPLSIGRSGIFGEHLSCAELHSFCYSLLWILSDMNCEEGAAAWFLVDCNWNMCFLVLRAGELLKREVRICHRLTESDTSGSEFNNLVGFRNMMKAEDKDKIYLDELTDHELSSGKTICQIVTYNTKKVWDTEYMLFSISSQISLSRVQGVSLGNREFFYPSACTDRSNWCVSKKTEEIGGCFEQLYVMRLQIKSRKTNRGTRSILEGAFERGKYPTRLLSSIYGGLEEIRFFSLPNHRFAVIRNAQFLQKKIRDMPIRKGRKIESPERYFCHSFLIMLALGLTKYQATKLLGRVKEYRYDYHDDVLIIKRGYSQSALLWDNYLSMKDEYPALRVKIRIDGYSKVYLRGISNKPGVHIYGD